MNPSGQNAEEDPPFASKDASLIDPKQTEWNTESHVDLPRSPRDRRWTQDRHRSVTGRGLQSGREDRLTYLRAFSDSAVSLGNRLRYEKLPIGPSTRHFLPDASPIRQYEAEHRQSIQDIHRAGLDGGEVILPLPFPLSPSETCCSLCGEKPMLHQVCSYRFTHEGIVEINPTYEAYESKGVDMIGVNAYR